MVANLTPQYHKAEEAFRNASTVEEKIAALEDMLMLMPKHKATERLQADLKKKLSQFRQDAIKQSASKKGVRKDPFHIEKSGGGQILLLGTPNGGKTSLVNALSRTELKVGEYPFTTQVPAPGMAPFEDIYLQMVDMPPITEDVIPPGMVGALRRGDIIAIVLNLGDGDLLEQVEICEKFLTEKGVIPKGLSVQKTEELEIEVGYAKPVLIIANKKDLDQEGNLEVFEELYEGELKIIPVSSKTGENLDTLMGRLFEMLDILRIYSKLPGKDPDMGAPFILPKGSTIENLAYEIHRDLPQNMKFARVWGTSAKFPGQQLQQNHPLADKDVVEIHD